MKLVNEPDPAVHRLQLEFGRVEDAHAWVDDWVIRHRPVRTTRDLAEFERRHLQRFETDFGRLHAAFEISFDVLVALIDEVNYVDKSAWPAHRSLQFMLVPHNVKAFVSAMDRLSRGYYEDSISLARGPYETFARLLFMSCHREYPYGAVFARVPPGQPKFDLTGFLRDQLRLDWSPIYSTMSVFAHSNTLAMARSLRRNDRREGSPEVFGLSFEDDEQTLGVAAAFLPFLLLAYTRFVSERLIDGAELRDPSLSTSASESIAWLEVCSKDGAPFWNTVCADLDYIFALLAIADAGREWRTIRESRPIVEARQVTFETPTDAI